MNKRKRLGQHFLNSSAVARLIVSAAEITKKDAVFEIGTGLGVLTTLLCKKAKKVVSYEADNDLYAQAQSKFGNIGNLLLCKGDGFRQEHDFSIFVSNLPYSKSRTAIEWLAQRQFSHGVIMVQKEFADKLIARSATDRRAVTVVARHTLGIQKVSDVGRDSFDPPPKVDSVVLKIVKKATLDKRQVESINRLFSYRRKKIPNILKRFGKESLIDKRLDDLSGEEIVDIAKDIAR